MSVCGNFEECAAKTVGGVGFLTKAYFSLPQCCQFLAHGCQNWDIDLKFKMGGRIGTILMCVQFGDDLISSLDFSFIGGVPLIRLIVHTGDQSNDEWNEIRDGKF